MDKNKVQEFLKYFCVIILAVLFIAFCFIEHYQEYASYISETTDFQSPLEITEGYMVSEDVIGEYNNLSALQILFNTSGRYNTSVVTLSLMEKDVCIQKWIIDCKWISDKVYLILNLNKKLKSSGNVYTIQMTSDAEPGNGIIPVNYKLQYATLEHKSGYMPFIIILIAVIIVAGGVWYIIQKYTFEIENAFLIFWCALSLLYVCSNTMYNAPDETHHFYRALEISMGHMVSDMNENQTKGGRELPLVNVNFSPGKWQSLVGTRDARFSEDTEFKGFSNTALYSPVSYIPQAAGIFAARVITDRLIFVTYAGRLANWLCVTIILYFVMKLLPFGKEFLAVVLLMPMNLHEAFSLAPDSMVIAVSVFMIAFVMYLRYVQISELSKVQILLLYVLALLISLYKIVYLPFCLIYLLIPSERFGDGKKMMLHAAIIAGMVIVLNVVWLQICNKFLTHAGANGTLQVVNILHHPFQYLITIFRTYATYTSMYLQQMVGAELGQLDVKVNTVLVFAYLFLLYHKMNVNFRIHFSWKSDLEKCIFGVVIISIIVLTSTSLYIQWTEVGTNIIMGLQGRYFIALLLPLYFVVTGTRHGDILNKEQLSLKSSFIVLITNACSAIALLFSCLK